MTQDAIRAEMVRTYEQELAPLYRALRTRRLEVRAEARRSHSRAGYAELAALRSEIGRLEARVCDLRGRYHALEAVA